MKIVISFSENSQKLEKKKPRADIWKNSISGYFLALK
ncbi:MAG: hypothetical protein ACI94Y_004381 [Maribacter sp.]|jgi:hypothetical protein